MPYVNESLSRALADRALAVLAAQQVRYNDGLATILQKDIRSKKGASAMSAALARLGERAQLIQVIGKTPNGRRISVCQFIPEVRANRTGRTQSIARFVLCSFLISSRGVQVGSDSGTALIANEHAIERLFLRLNTMNLGAVITELHDAMLLSLPLAIVGRALGIRQVVLPTSSGGFLCELPDTTSILVAKTWLASDRLGPRWSPVAARIRNAIEVAGGESALALVLATGIKAAIHDEDHTVFDRLTRALSGIHWLEEAYSPRLDPVGDIWRRARHAAGGPGPSFP